MKIFEKRPLSLILCITLGVFFLFSVYDDFYFRLTICFALLALLIFSFFNRKVFLKIAVISAIASIIFSYVYFDLWFKAYERYDGEVTITGTVQSFDNSSYNSVVHIKTDDIDGTDFSEYNLIVYLDKDLYYGYSIGSKVKLKGVIESVSNSENFDAESYYNSRGISGFVNEVSHFEMTDVGEYPLSYKIIDFRQTICRKIIYTSNEEVGGLLCALLLGEKEYLPVGTKLDFSRIGISHVLALSGMHLAILTIGFTKLLRFLRCGKKTSTVIGIIFTLLYMSLTGFSVSVTRAGFMLIISSLLYLFSRSKDSFTSLFVAVTVICLFEPYSIYDTSLWLSAFATLGIVVLGEYLSMKYSKASFLKWIATSFLSSLFAISATFAITTLKFDGISLIAPITTLLFSLLIEVFIYVGLVLLLFGSILPIKHLLIPIGNFILYAADSLSEIKQVYVSTNFTVVKILALLFSILFFSFLIMRIKHKRAVIFGMTALLVGVFTTSAIMTYSTQNRDRITYFGTSSEKITISDDGEIGLINISNYKKNEAYSTYAVIANSNLTHVDSLILTHYTYNVEDYAKTLFDSILIDTIYLPVPQNKTEERILFGVAELASDAGTKLEMYQNEDPLKIGEAAVFPLYNSALGTSKKNMLTILKEDKFYTYLNVNSLLWETKNMALEVISGTHALILGRHGDGNYDYNFTHEIDTIEKIVIASKKIILHENILEFYIDKIVSDGFDGVDLYVE